jgi:hypothetical protein
MPCLRILQQAEALVWLKARTIIMYALGWLFALGIGVKLAIDYYQASGIARTVPLGQ